MPLTMSIVAHSSTDVPVARLFHVEDIAGLPPEEPAEKEPGPADPSPSG